MNVNYQETTQQLVFQPVFVNRPDQTLYPEALTDVADRAGPDPLYFETKDGLKYWDRFDKKWVLKLKINY
jgi:hypothetical protein